MGQDSVQINIKVLARRGTAVREIARQMGLSRNTVRRYLRDGQAGRYKQREPRPTKLDPFKDYLLERVAAARPHWIPATVLLRELQDAGYEGGISQLKAFLAPHKRVAIEPVVRFETPPGKQMQADFTVIRRGRAPLLALVATLGYSRASFVRFTAGEDATTLCECLREAFAYFGGTPEQVLFDNAKSVVVERNAFGVGQHRWNTQLLALAETYGFTPKVCQPYRAKTKGKVERFNRYLKESFVVPLAATLKQAGLKLDVEAANARIGRWLAEVANVRVHATTHERPAARLGVEQAALLPLPAPTSAPMPVVSKLRRVLPRESLQHPLAVYDALLEVAA
ncbi:IS21 family transposase [Ralstonia solanacearum]|uniref:IS21 family transposase n=1 Tax=Ralstonia solanacearum TaxID=305 RepID=UPI0018679686|nr:IS21 family transposase [Ralstonia solanacearum]